MTAKTKVKRSETQVTRQSDTKITQPGGVDTAARREERLLEMDEAIAMLKTTRSTFYRWLRAGEIRGMKVGRQWRFERREIERFLKGEEPRIEVRGDIDSLITTLADKAREFVAKKISLPEETPVQRVVKLCLEIGFAMAASDFTITPHITGKGDEKTGTLRFRVDGVLHLIAHCDIRVLPAVIEEWKRLAGCDVRETMLPQDGMMKMTIPETQDVVDFRVCFVPTILGESMTGRFLHPAVDLKKDLDSLGYSPRDLEKIRRAIRSPWGVLAITAPTGCGKTTTHYACLSQLAGEKTKIMTIEDPVEYQLPWVVHVPVNEQAGMTFARALRYFLRSAPNIILVGEIRDGEVAMICHQAAMTGHLVFTTLHADEAAKGLVRMMEVGVPSFVVADALKVMISQRLIRVLCPDCSREETPSDHALTRAQRYARLGGLDWDSLPKKFRRPVGCAKCRFTGYRGRTVVAEVLEVTPEIGQALRRGATADELRVIAVGQGMTTMAADGVRKAAEGITTVDEVICSFPLI